MTSRVRTGATACAVTLVLLAFEVLAADDSVVEKGEYLAHAGGCISCHTADEDEATPLAGGRALASPFGTF